MQYKNGKQVGSKWQENMKTGRMHVRKEMEAGKKQMMQEGEQVGRKRFKKWKPDMKQAIKWYSRMYTCMKGKQVGSKW